MHGQHPASPCTGRHRQVGKPTNAPRQLPDTANTDRDHNRVATRATTASIWGKGMDKEDIRRCIEIIQSSRRRRREQQTVTKRPATEGGPPALASMKSPTQGRSGDGSDGTHAAARGHANTSGSGGNDSEDSDRIVFSEAPWPYMDPKQ